MKLLDSIHDFTKIIFVDGVLHLGQSCVKIVEWKFLFDNEAGCQSFQCPAKLVDLDDVGITKFEDTGTTAVSFCYKALSSQDVKRFPD